MTALRTLAFIGTIIASAGTASAHHGFGTFDLSRDINITGTIARMEFINPHSWLYVTVADANGVASTYRCEMRGATVLRRSGWTADMFVPGEEITVQAAPDHNDPHSCYVNTLILASGIKLDRYTQRPVPIHSEGAAQRVRRLPNGDVNISGDWAPEQHVMSDPRGLRGTLVPLHVASGMAPGEIPKDRVPMLGMGTRDDSWLARIFGIYRVIVGAARLAPAPEWMTATVQLTPAGRKASGDLPATERMPFMNCEITSILQDWLRETTVNRITQREDAIVLEYGQFGFTRTIHMQMAEHPSDLEASRAGHSIGRWENDVLVVDTVGFAPGILGDLVPHTGRLHVVERFTLDNSKMALTREYVADDPEYFATPYRGSDTVFPSPVPYAVDRCKDMPSSDRSQP
jgi:hypothetical protein